MFGIKTLVRAAVAGLLTAGTAIAQDQDVARASFSVVDVTTVFSVNMPSNSTDLYMTIVHPAFSWGAYGIGTSMKDALMFVFYKSKTNSTVTISPRRSMGHVEPSYDPSVEFELLYGAQNVSKPFWYFSLRCKNCRSLMKLDEKDTQAPFMFATGPDAVIVSDSPSAYLHQHLEVATFTLDLTKASDPGAGGPPRFVLLELPDNGFTDGKLINQHRANDHLGSLHAWIAAFSVLILLPAGSIFLIVFKSVKWHIINSAFFFLLFFISFGVGIADSLRYNQTKKFNTPHQVLGLVSTALFLVLTFLPLIPKVKEISKIHSWGGRLTYALAIVVGGLGIKLSDTGMIWVSAYIAVVVLSNIILMTVYWLYNWRKSKGQLAAEIKRGEEIELQIRRIQEIRAERDPPPAYQ